MELDRHFNHDIVIARYGPSDEPVEYAVECETCFEVIVWEEAQPQPSGCAAPGLTLFTKNIKNLPK